MNRKKQSSLNLLEIQKRLFLIKFFGYVKRILKSLKIHLLLRIRFLVHDKQVE